MFLRSTGCFRENLLKLTDAHLVVSMLVFSYDYFYSLWHKQTERFCLSKQCSVESRLASSNLKLPILLIFVNFFLDGCSIQEFLKSFIQISTSVLPSRFTDKGPEMFWM